MTLYMYLVFIPVGGQGLQVAGNEPAFPPVDGSGLHPAGCSHPTSHTKQSEFPKKNMVCIYQVDFSLPTRHLYLKSYAEKAATSCHNTLPVSMSV